MKYVKYVKVRDKHWKTHKGEAEETDRDQKRRTSRTSPQRHGKADR